MRAALLPNFGVKTRSWQIFCKEMFHLTALYIWGEHTAGSALLGSPKPHRNSPWPGMGLWESCVGSSIKPLSAFRHSWTSQQSQVRWAQHLHHHMLTLLPQFQHVRTRNSLLGGTVFIQNVPKMGKESLGDAIKKPLHLSGQFEHCAFCHLAEAGDGEAKGRACPCRHSALWWIWSPGLLDWSL